MKKLILGAAAALMFAMPAYAAVGDIAGTVYTTDILTQVDGRDIKSYSIKGETLIALEDLKDYGFSVYYNNNIRTVFVTKTGEAAEDFAPDFPRGKVGGTDGYIYETDIRAVVNGMHVKAYAIDGKMIAKVEDLGLDGGLSNAGRHTYQMTCTYDDNERLLSLDTSLSKYGIADGGRDVAANYRLWGPISSHVIHSGDKLMAEKKYGGLPHGGIGYTSYVSLDNGLIYDVRGIAGDYGLYMSDAVFSSDGSKLYFINTDALGNFRDYKQLELDNMHIYPLSEEEYVKASEEFKISDYKLEYEGETYPLYQIGSHDHIKLSDLEFDEELAVNIHEGEKYVPISNFKEGDEHTFAESGELLFKYDVYNKTVKLIRAE